MAIEAPHYSLLLFFFTVLSTRLDLLCYVCKLDSLALGVFITLYFAVLDSVSAKITKTKQLELFAIVQQDNLRLFFSLKITVSACCGVATP